MSERYRRWPGRREGGRWCRRVACLAVAALTAGCSVAGPGLSDDDGPVATGSIARVDVSPLSPDLGQEDWRRAKGSLAIALDPQGNGSAVKWDNPDSEVSGTFTPVAQPYVRANEICRAFLATIAFPGRTSSLQGTACRLSGDEWRLQDVKPWRRPT